MRLAFIFTILLSLSTFACNELFLAPEDMATYPMRSIYVGEQFGKSLDPNQLDPDITPFKIKYFSETERKQFEVTVQEGPLRYSNGQNVTDGIFVLNARCELYVYPEIWNKFLPDHVFVRHSSLTQGAPVAAAGQIQLVKGLVQSVNNQSGHYHPPFEALQSVLECLKKKGVETSTIRLEKAL